MVCCCFSTTSNMTLYRHFGGFAYVKFVLLWLSCIALDLLIGFRFELLYPVWLLMRNCYDSFRFQGLVSSLQYSVRFLPFFIFVTATKTSPSKKFWILVLNSQFFGIINFRLFLHFSYVRQ